MIPEESSFRFPDADECLVSHLIRSSHGSFARFAKIYEKSHVETGGCTLNNNVEKSEVSLFPSRLPWIKPPIQSRGRRGPTSRQRWVALARMHWLWGLFNFLECGSPCSRSAAQAVANRASCGVWTDCHESLARTMYTKVLKFVSHPEGTLDRGTAKLDDLIKRIRLSFYDSSLSLEEALTGVLDVDPNRISLPAKGGILDPLNHLTGRQLEEFRNMHKDVPHGLLVGKDIKPCHKVDSKNWPFLLRKLYDADMITFLPEAQALRENGHLIKGGLFCVPHKATSDRLINDRRPLNARENRLNWSKLPSGQMLCQLILEPGQSIRCSGDDLSNYFYLIKHSEEWLPRNCFGDPIWGSQLPGIGLEPGTRYLPSFKVVCMGDTNGVDIAQATHESVLKAAGCMSKENTLVYGEIMPPSNTLEGLYIDDHLVFQIVDSKKNRSREKSKDEILLKASRDKYQELGLPRSEKKAFEKSYDFKAWGTQVTSASGRVGSPFEKLKQIEALTHALVLEGKASKKALQKLLGLYVHPFMHRRELMSLFHHSYLYIENLPEKGLSRMPAYVGDELITAMMMLPLAECNIRAPVSVQVSATDASSQMGGRASTITSPALAKTLYRFSECRGEHVRMDWESHGLEPPTTMQPAPIALVDVMQHHCWTASQSLKFSKKEHINILELEMVKQEIKARANSGKSCSRIVNLCDSRVVVGAFGKGRSSSKSLNHKLRSCVPWLLVADLHLVNLWVPTDKNPADYPSRGKPIPKPVSSENNPLLSSKDLQAVARYRSIGVQNLLERESRNTGCNPLASEPCDFEKTEIMDAPLTRNQSPDSRPPEEPKSVTEQGKAAIAEASTSKPRLFWAFREIFAGKGRLTRQVRRHQILEVLDPVEYLQSGVIDENQNILNDRTFKRLKKDAKRKRQIWHFGMPCSSFSILQHSNGGTRRKTCPQGTGVLRREEIGNRILERTLILISILEKHGNYWTLENPRSSYLWDMPGVWDRIQDSKYCVAIMDQCSYGLKLLDKNGLLGPCKKPTLFLGNIPGLACLAAKCQCSVEHVHAVGGVRTKHGWRKRSELAGHYPLKLCNAYVKMIHQLVEEPKDF